MHRLWHVLLLWATLCAVAAAAILVLGPLLFQGRAAGPQKARSAALVVTAAAAGLLVAEWLVVHGRSL